MFDQLRPHTLNRHGRRHSGAAEQLFSGNAVVRCCQQQHTVGLDKRGHFVFHNHSPDDLRRRRELEEIGGPVCGCLKLLRRWHRYVEGQIRLARLPKGLWYAAYEARARHKNRQDRPRRRRPRSNPWPFDDLPWDLNWPRGLRNTLRPRQRYTLSLR